MLTYFRIDQLIQRFHQRRHARRQGPRLTFGCSALLRPRHSVHTVTTWTPVGAAHRPHRIGMSKIAPPSCDPLDNILKSFNHFGQTPTSLLTKYFRFQLPLPSQVSVNRIGSPFHLRHLALCMGRNGNAPEGHFYAPCASLRLVFICIEVRNPCRFGLADRALRASLPAVAVCHIGN